MRREAQMYLRVGVRHRPFSAAVFLVHLLRIVRQLFIMTDILIQFVTWKIIRQILQVCRYTNSMVNHRIEHYNLGAS